MYKDMYYQNTQLRTMQGKLSIDMCILPFNACLPTMLWTEKAAKHRCDSD